MGETKKRTKACDEKAKLVQMVDLDPRLDIEEETSKEQQLGMTTGQDGCGFAIPIPIRIRGYLSHLITRT